MKYITLIICLCSFCSLEAKEENPFLKMKGKKYNEFGYDLREEFGRFMELDANAAQVVIEQLKDAARINKESQWELVATFFELSHPVRFETTTPEEIVNQTKDLIEKSRKAKIPFLTIQSLSKIAFINRYVIKNYEIAFEYYRKVDKELQNISQDDFPEKPEYYYAIADYYYQFRDYEMAAIFFRKILDNKIMPYSERVFIHARNGLGLCYRYHDNDLDESDKWFNSILNTKMSEECKESRYDQWEGIAIGNLGHNMFLRKKYNKAIALLLPAYNRALKYDDYGYAARTATTLAEAYRNTDNLHETKKYIDSARKLFGKEEYFPGQYRFLYAVITKYYSAIKKPHLSIVYMDSTIYERNAYNKHFNTLLFLRAEQRAGIFEQKAKDEELRLEKEQKNALTRNFITVSIGLLLVFVLLVMYYILYRKKRAAYKELVRKSKEWANVDKITEDSLSVTNYCAEKKNGKNTSSNENYQAIMLQFYQLVLDDKLYKWPEITLDTTAEKLNVNRVYLSQAINQTTGSSFTTFINENRVKEAIRIMSAQQTENLSLDGVAFETGFNDRISFYRAFKKITGISPSEFRKNQKE